jgi:superfamily II DNA or RNA helicase
MLAHREARGIAFGTAGKLRVLADLLAQHHPARTLIFTDDNATVYRISQAFLIPAITHKTAVKERHDILSRFRSGDYPALVTSRVLNEGVDVPEASIAIVLSGTGSTREYIQRLGRILRRGEGKLAVLYEVIAEATSEENTSRRRHGQDRKPEPSATPQAYDQLSLPSTDLLAAEGEGDGCYRPSC